MFKKATLRKSALLFGAFLTLASAAQAQIIYTDIAPDGLPPMGGFDFNHGGVQEIELPNPTYLSYTYEDGGTNIWANGNMDDGWDVPKPLDFGTVINASGNFIGGGDASMDAWGAGTPFPVGVDKFIGVRLSIFDNTHYGWIRVQWDGSNFIYKDYAYESTPNQAIQAGETTPTSVHEVNAGADFRLFPIPAQGTVTVVPAKNATQAIIVDLTGKQIKSFQLVGMQSQTLPIEDLSAGNYLIQFLNQQQVLGVRQLIVR